MQKMFSASVKQFNGEIWHGDVYKDESEKGIIKIVGKLGHGV